MLAPTMSRVLLGRKDGSVQAFDRKTLKEDASAEPWSGSYVRFLEVSPDGAQVAATLHDETLWLFDDASDQWQRARVAGQGDISAAHWADDGALYVADRGTRVSVYEPGSLELRTRYAPAWSPGDILNRYVISPLYFVFPKPGELYKTFDHLVMSEGDTDASVDEASTARSRSSPLTPVWSGLAFIVVMLGLTCLYFQRQEY